ncbi:uncharacterized protein IL334_001448 [Kwoniella shivajii]|uniref:F-box domain-containing protein n=1 Tax=Kwoniella shivajii TaxID=564305 RepID=A0ABZ1CS73_9TREE|nr:hypothetical protein IL334_001448 [Kwoniella shivajii]
MTPHILSRLLCRPSDSKRPVNRFIPLSDASYSTRPFITIITPSVVDQGNNRSPFALDQLPDPVTALIIEFLPISNKGDLHSLTLCSKDTYRMFSPLLYKSIKINKNNVKSVFYGFKARKAMDLKPSKSALLRKVERLFIEDLQAAQAIAQVLDPSNLQLHHVPGICIPNKPSRSAFPSVRYVSFGAAFGSSDSGQIEPLIAVLASFLNPVHVCVTAPTHLEGYNPRVHSWSIEEIWHCLVTWNVKSLTGHELDYNLINANLELVNVPCLPSNYYTPHNLAMLKKKSMDRCNDYDEYPMTFDQIAQAYANASDWVKNKFAVKTRMEAEECICCGDK